MVQIANASSQRSGDDQAVPDARDATTSDAVTPSSHPVAEGESQSFVNWAQTAIVRNSQADEGALNPDRVGLQESASSPGEIDSGRGIPGAVVAVIFGVFGLLVVARRTSSSR